MNAPTIIYLQYEGDDCTWCVDQIIDQYVDVLTFSTITCYKCGIPFGVPAHFKTKRLQDKADFWCPNGHCQAYCESEADRLRKQIEREKANTQHYREMAESRGRQRDTAEHRVRAMKGVVTKIKKRVGNGVCPCCTRSFQNLARHMENQHPEYAKQDTITQP